jgi:hypothetical protein
MAKIYHPDINHSVNASKNFIEIREAYDFLLNYYNEQYLDAEETLNKQNQKDGEDYYYDWIKHNREKARKQAAYEASMKFEKFKQSKAYRTTFFFNKITNYIIFISGIIIIFGAIYGLHIRGLYYYENGKMLFNYSGLIAAISITFVGSIISIFSIVFHRINR